MAREISGRILITGTLVARTPLHVGGHGDDADTDLPLARDGRGQCYVPGTSLAGPLRHWCQHAFGEDNTNPVWGFQDDRDADAGHASFTIVKDSPIDDSDRVVVEVRDGVGIDREWGVAAERIKFDRAILPRGSRLPLRLVVEVPDESNRPRALGMFASLVAELAAEDLRVGAAKTRGLGRVALVDAQWREQDFHSRAGILSVLRGGSRPIDATELSAARLAFPPRPRPRLDVTIRWRPAGPLMVKAGYDGIGVDSLPLVSRVENRLALVLPGSSVKGSLRTQAERIIRTLLGELLPLGQEKDKKSGARRRVQDSNRRFLEDLEVPLVESLFGARGRGPREKKGRENDHGDVASWRLPRNSPLPGLGALGIDDCYSTQSFDAATWQRIASAKAELKDTAANAAMPVTEELDTAGVPDWSTAFHNAVDRWTGGAADRLLFSVLEPRGVDWEPLRLRIDFDRLSETERLPAVALVWLVLRDLCQRRIPLGYGTNRGMGEVEVQSIEFAPRDLDPLQGGSFQLTTAGSVVPPIMPPPVLDLLNRAWKAWLAAVRRGRGGEDANS